MAKPKDQNYTKKPENQYLTKKCPECYTYLSLHARTCTACKSKVGDVDKLGFAEKPFDWLGYLLAVLAIAGFAIFVWWAFFNE